MECVGFGSLGRRRSKRSGVHNPWRLSQVRDEYQFEVIVLTARQIPTDGGM